MAGATEGVAMVAEEMAEVGMEEGGTVAVVRVAVVMAVVQRVRAVMGTAVELMETGRQGGVKVAVRVVAVRVEAGWVAAAMVVAGTVVVVMVVVARAAEG